MSSPWAALSFATLFTAVLGSLATQAEILAPLPLYSLILLTHTMLPISVSVSVIIALSLSILHIVYRIGMSFSETADLNLKQIFAEIIFLASGSISG